MTFTVRAMTNADTAQWDRFVLSAEGGTFFHLAGMEGRFPVRLRPPPPTT